MYAVCVIWPFRLDPTIGLAVGGLAAIGILMGYFIRLAKRLIAQV